MKFPFHHFILLMTTDRLLKLQLQQQNLLALKNIYICAINAVSSFVIFTPSFESFLIAVICLNLLGTTLNMIQQI